MKIPANKVSARFICVFDMRFNLMFYPRRLVAAPREERSRVSRRYRVSHTFNVVVAISTDPTKPDGAERVIRDEVLVVSAALRFNPCVLVEILAPMSSPSNAFGNVTEVVARVVDETADGFHVTAVQARNIVTEPPPTESVPSAAGVLSVVDVTTFNERAPSPECG